MNKIGIIGCGAVARRSHIPAWQACSNIEIAALCDPNTEATAEVVQRHSLKCECFTSLDELLERSDVEVVDICTPGFMHYEQAKQCLLAGKHVLVEKPPVMRVEQAEELIDIADAADLKLAAIFNFRYHDIMMAAKKHLDKGIIGDVAKISVVHHAGNIYAEAPWLWEERKSKYLLYDFGIHFLDAAIYICGPHAEVVSVVALPCESTGETTDLHIIIRFENGAVGTFEFTSDFTKHSSSQTIISVYGTAMDMFMRRFPAMVRVTAGIPNPFEVVHSEIKALWGILWKIMSGKYLAWRNVTHARILKLYANWLDGGADYPLDMKSCLPTLRLLRDIEREVPAYREDENTHPGE